MSELERELRNVGAEIEYPPTPDLAGAVRERIEARRRSRFSLSRRKLALALAILAAGVGAAMATPQARTAILEWLGLRGVAIERVATRPDAALGDELDLGERVSLREARRRAGFSPLVPRAGGLGDPDEVSSAPRRAGTRSRSCIERATANASSSRSFALRSVPSSSRSRQARGRRSNAWPSTASRGSGSPALRTRLSTSTRRANRSRTRSASRRTRCSGSEAR